MILVLGGIKSGKTSWAEKYAAQWASRREMGQVVYLASALAWDDEMKLRIHRHKQSRPEGWLTIEEPLNIAQVLSHSGLGKNDIVIFDCLTLWLTNLLMGLDENFEQEAAEMLIESELGKVLCSIKEFPGEVIVISNLVETGLVSPHFLGRIFQELAGRSHQRLASESDETILITAGLPQWLKR